MKPRWWLSRIEKAERLTSIAGAVSVAWLLAVYLISSVEWRRIHALAAIFVMFFAAIILGGATWMWKTVLTEMIEDEESDVEWKKIKENRWPSG